MRDARVARCTQQTTNFFEALGPLTSTLLFGEVTVFVCLPSANPRCCPCLVATVNFKLKYVDGELTKVSGRRLKAVKLQHRRTSHISIRQGSKNTPEESDDTEPPIPTKRTR